MPSEWEPHACTWMGWPERPDMWKHDAKPAQQAFAALATAIAEFEPVVVTANATQLARARAMLPAHPNIDIKALPQDDVWFRDTTPSFLVAHKPPRAGKATRDLVGVSAHQQTTSGIEALAGVEWVFNGYGGFPGGMHPGWIRDKAVAKAMCEMTGCRRFKCPMVLEGGSIHVDGAGTLITTEECLLNSNRNPDLTKADIETRLKSMLGVTKVIWLPRGVVGDDDTNGHVDNMACFAREGVVLLAWADADLDVEQHRRSSEALNVLEAETDARGRTLSVIKVPLPPPMYATKDDVASLYGRVRPGVWGPEGKEKLRREGDRLAGSYINLYIVNGGVVMPGFGNPVADERARVVIEEAFPDRRVVQVPTRDILLGGGNIHCVTCQQPSV
jgi:agmatine deiminase